jgi:hypothetical protein
MVIVDTGKRASLMVNGSKEYYSVVLVDGKEAFVHTQSGRFLLPLLDEEALQKVMNILEIMGE